MKTPRTRKARLPLSAAVGGTLLVALALVPAVPAQDPGNGAEEIPIPQIRVGHAQGDLVRVGSNAYVEPGERVRELVVVFGNAKMEGEVERDMVVVFGHAEINGRIGGDFVNVMGSTRLGPEADLGRDCVVVGGKLEQEEGARLAHQPVNVNFGGLFKVIEPIGQWFRHGLLLGRPLPLGVGWAWGMAVLFFVIYLVIALLLPKPVAFCVKVLETQPVQSFVAGILGLILAGPVLFILAASGLGLFLIPFLWLAFTAATFLGKTATFQYFGGLLYGRLSPGATPAPLVTFLVGVGLVTLLYILPIFGIVVWGTLLTLAFGTAIMAAITTLKRNGGEGARQLAPALSSGPSGPPSGAPAPAGTMALATPAKPTRTGKAGAAGKSKRPGKSTRAGSVAVGSEEGVPPPVSPTEQGAADAAAAGGTKAVLAPAPLTASGRVVTAADLAEMPRVGFFHRFAASLLDFVLLGWIWAALGFGWFVLAWLGYHIGLWLWKGTTIGGIICGIKIVRTDPRELDASIVVVRALAAVLSFVALGLGFFWAGWVPEKQSWHDKVAGTTIVRLPKGTSLV